VPRIVDPKPLVEQRLKAIDAEFRASPEALVGP
jgi:hypothetical protein